MQDLLRARETQKFLGTLEIDFPRREKKVTLSIKRDIEGGKGRLRIEFLSSPLKGSIFINDGETQWYYNPEKRIAVKREGGAGNGFRHPGRGLMDRVAQRWKGEMMGEEVIAGRKAWKVEAARRRAVDGLLPEGRRQLTGRRGRKRVTLWIDQEKKVLLGFQQQTAEGEPLLSVRFTSISFPPSFDDREFRFTPPSEAQVITNPPRFGKEALLRMKEVLEFTPVMPDPLPEGMKFRGGKLTKFQGGRGIQLLFSMGQEYLSIFERKDGKGKTGLEKRRRDGKEVYVGTWEEQGIQITVVGTLPPEKMQALKGTMTKPVGEYVEETFPAWVEEAFRLMM